MSNMKLSLEEFLRRGQAAQKAVDNVMARQLKDRIAKRLKDSRGTKGNKTNEKCN